MHLTINKRNVDIAKLHKNATNLIQIQTEEEAPKSHALRTRSV